MNNIPLSTILKYEEKVTGKIDGTIVDIETIGVFDKRYKGESREYMHLKQVILGCIDGEKLHVYCARGAEGIAELIEVTREV